MFGRALEICKELVCFNSVTYTESEILDYVADILKKLDFKVDVLEFSAKDENFSTGFRKVKNLFATRGSSEKVLGILGHLDTVPAGEGWHSDPFTATEIDSKLYGRGIVDMKGGAGCLLAALEEMPVNSNSKINIFFTCDEEVGSYEGTRALLDWAKAHDQLPTDCLICEPSSDEKICDRIYIGHRGSINITVKAKGEQAHSAYINKQTANNALEKICEFVSEISEFDFGDDGKNFEKTIASPTMIEASNLAVNVIPPHACVNFNVRFSDKFSSDDIINIFRKKADLSGLEIEYTPSGEPYICRDKELINCAQKAISKTLGYEAELSTGGGTSDGRFMVSICPIIELGMVDKTLHQIDEHVEVDDCEKLKNVYKEFIKNYFE